MCCNCGGGFKNTDGKVPSPAPTATRYPSPVPIPAPTPTCVDSNYGAVSAYNYFGCSDSDGATYGAIGEYGTPGSYCGSYADDDFTAADMCCACGGGGVFGKLPTFNPSPAPTSCVPCGRRRAMGSADTRHTRHAMDFANLRENRRHVRSRRAPLFGYMIENCCEDF